MNVTRDDFHDARAAQYSPFGFRRGGEGDRADAFYAGLARNVADGDTTVVTAGGVRLFVRQLAWDSAHFGRPFYRLDFVDWPFAAPSPQAKLAEALAGLKTQWAVRHPRHYLFAEIPSEDTIVLQALGRAGFGLVETRLAYVCDDTRAFAPGERFAVREATEADIPNLRAVARDARNPFDRYHADGFFTAETADDYLATFVENSVRGFADFVLVPAEGPGPPGAFFTATLASAASALAPTPQGQIVLVAVGPERQGWHWRLLVETTQHLADRGAGSVVMSTQSTNRAVIRNCEKAGYRYGRSTHILSCYP